MNTVDVVRFLSGIGMAVPTPNQRQTMKVHSSLIPLSASDLPDVPFPTNESEAVRQELDYLAALRPSKDEKKFARLVDTDLAAPFRDYIRSHGLQVVVSDIDYLLSESVPLVLASKFKYQRLRPRELAYMYGIDLDVYPSKTVNTPSYPSGHALQAYLIAYVLGAKFPDHAGALEEIARRIGLSRLHLAVHYPSDVDAGQFFASQIAKSVGSIFDRKNRT
jgi:hypothetical protein